MYTAALSKSMTLKQLDHKLHKGLLQLISWHMHRIKRDGLYRLLDTIYLSQFSGPGLQILARIFKYM